MKNMIILLLLAVSAVTCFASDKYSALLKTAENAFGEGNYGKTIEIYETLVQVEKVNDPYVYYNLSNAYYRNAQLGKAVLNIEKAYLLKPRDKDIRYNRHFLEAAAGMPEGGAGGEILEKITGLCSLNGMTVIAALLLAFAMAFKTAYLIKRKTVLNKAALISAVFFIAFAVILAVKANREMIDSPAVILDDTAVRSGPGDHNPEIFNISQGRKVYISGNSNGWSYVAIKPEGLSGWVKSEKTEAINAGEK